MSREAMEWALETRVGDPTRGLVLVAIGKHADRYGKGAWASPETLSEYAECSPRTVQRHIASLIEGGLIREGDQSVIPDHIPKRRRPIVYDLAMSLAAAEEWASQSGSGRRAAAATAGAAAGRKGAARRAEVRASATPWGDTDDTPLAPETGDTHDTPYLWGDTDDTPGDTPQGEPWGDKLGDTGDTQTREEPKNKTKTRRSGKPLAAKDDQQADPIEAQARAIVRAYMDWWAVEKGSPILKSSQMFNALARSYVAPALRLGHSDPHLRSCLAECARSGNEWPSEAQWRRVLDGKNRTQYAKGGPDNTAAVTDLLARAAQAEAEEQRRRSIEGATA